MRRTLAGLTALLIGAGTITACSSDGSDTGSARNGDCPTAPVPVVVSVDQWGDIVDQLAGDCGAVTTIIKSSSADPHDYEPTPSDSAKFTDAKLVVQNGLDYDPWVGKTIDTLDTKPTVVDGGRVVGLEPGANPHIWYGPTYVRDMSRAVTAALKKLQPKDATYFDQRAAKWKTTLAPYDAEIAKIKPVAAGKTYAATEGVFDDMAHALGLRDRTPAGYRRATANGSDPAPGDVNEFQHALASKKIDVLVDNTQTEGSIPAQIRSRAEAARVPIVDVTETVPPGTDSFVSWQVVQLRHLAKALGS